jgi:hypothetical protein
VGLQPAASQQAGFPMMQPGFQLDTNQQGALPMMQQGMWNLPIGQWPQFFGALNPMMQMPVGQFAGMQQSSNSNSCAGGQGAVQAPQPQQPVQAGGKNKKKGQAQSADAARKVNDKPDQQLSAGGVLDLKFKDVICYNCGESGHYVGLCTRQKRCFIRSKPGHHMDNCPMWYSQMPTAQYWGSANSGLDFFHVEVEGPAAVQWLNMDNVGIVVVNEGEISEQELEQNFNEMWKVKWFW